MHGCSLPVDLGGGGVFHTWGFIWFLSAVRIVGNFLFGSGELRTGSVGLISSRSLDSSCTANGRSSLGSPKGGHLMHKVAGENQCNWFQFPQGGQLIYTRDSPRAIWLGVAIWQRYTGNKPFCVFACAFLCIHMRILTDVVTSVHWKKSQNDLVKRDIVHPVDIYFFWLNKTKCTGILSHHEIRHHNLSSWLVSYLLWFLFFQVPFKQQGNEWKNS